MTVPSWLGAAPPAPGVTNTRTAPVGGLAPRFGGVQHPGRPRPLRLVRQLAGAAILIPFGLTTQFIPHPLTGQIVALGPLGPLFTILWVVGVVNAMNFIDGVDGLASGIAALPGTAPPPTALAQ